METKTQQPRDAGNWAKPVSTLNVGDVPAGAIALNVEGRRLVGAQQGFGQLWRKTYRARLHGADVTPQTVVATWKEHFGEFWPAGNHFYPSLTQIAPGEVAVLNLALAGNVPLSTGVLVIYADDESFTFMNPEGHMFSGWVTFSAFEDAGETVAQVQVLVRANDPIYEMGMVVGVLGRKEDAHWRHTLKALAAHFGVASTEVELQSICVDRGRQWSKAGNVWHNAGVRSVLYALAAPVRSLSRRAGRARAGQAAR
jgi:hypothetical protein